MPNRRQRRTAATMNERIFSRPGTGYTKRSASKAKKAKTGWGKRIILEMKDNEQVAENVNSGKLDKYL